MIGRLGVALLAAGMAAVLAAPFAGAADLDRKRRQPAPPALAGTADDCFPDALFPVYSSSHAPGADHAALRAGLMRQPVVRKGDAAVSSSPPGTRRVWQVTRDGWGRILGCWVTVPLEIVTHEHGTMLALGLGGYKAPPYVPGSLERAEFVRPGYPEDQQFPRGYGGGTPRPVAIDPQTANWQRKFFPN